MTLPSKDSEPEQATAANPGRRAFIRAATTIAAGSVALGNLGKAAAAPEELPAPDEDASDEAVAGGDTQAALQADRDLVRTQRRIRVEAARANFELSVPTHPTNGDEDRYPSKIGSDTRGLPHDQLGEVDAAAWAAAVAALEARSWEQIEGITLGGTRKLVNPIGTLAASLEGKNVAQVLIPPAPALASEERAAEAVEQYWQALLRDVSYLDFERNDDARAAAEELSGLPGYTGPREDGVVTPRILFRGSVRYPDPGDSTGRTPKHVIPPGVLEGPAISQFAYRDVPYGTQRIAAVSRVPVKGQDFLIDYDEWLANQDGAPATRQIEYEAEPRHLSTVRDLNEYTHAGNPLFWGAILQLAAAAGGTPTAPGGVGAPVSATNPYKTAKAQSGANGTFGTGYLQALLNLGISRAIRAAYWSKWFVHRSVRPEAYGGLVHNFLEKKADYPIHESLLHSRALTKAASTFGTHLIPHAYPEGAPNHGSYPAGSAAIAGVSATLIKAFFDESYAIPNPVTVDPADPKQLLPYEGPALTVGGELNKLALNYTFGRVTSGIHWRSDSAAGLVVGEEIAIGILRDERLTFVEPFEGWKLTKFDGTQITV